MPPKASAATPATEALRRAGIAYSVHAYDVPAAGAGASKERVAYGPAAAAGLGVDPARVFKTLVVMVDDRPVAAVLPVSAELDLKRAAAAAGGRRAEMAEVMTAERLSGSVVGGISPVAMRRPLPTFVDASASLHPTILVSAGRRGLQVELAPADLIRVAGATIVPLSREAGGASVHGPKSSG